MAQHTGVLYPSEFDTSRLRLGTKRSFGKSSNDWCMDLFYDDLPLQLQTPWMKNVFGLSDYKQPNGRVAYSLSFELSQDSEVADFHKFLLEFEEWFQEQLASLGCDLPFFSSIRQPNNPVYSPTLRVKLKTKHYNYDCKYFEGHVASQRWPIGEKRVKHGDLCHCIIQLMPVWCAGNRVGTSWKLVGLQKQAQTAFRDSEPGLSREAFNGCVPRDDFFIQVDQPNPSPTPGPHTDPLVPGQNIRPPPLDDSKQDTHEKENPAKA